MQLRAAFTQRQQPQTGRRNAARTFGRVNGKVMGCSFVMYGLQACVDLFRSVSAAPRCILGIFYNE
jgi:hypothetical protein